MIFSNTGLELSTTDRRWRLYGNGYAPVGIKPGSKHPCGVESLEWPRKLRDDPAHYCKNISPRHPFCGIGCDGLRPIDGDIDDPARMARLQEYVGDHFSEVPTRFRDDSPRKSYLFRAAEGQPSKAYVKNDVTDEGVEVLGYGNQCFVFGYHPYGEPLQWTGSPLQIKRADLPPITEDQVSDLLTFAADLIGATKRSNERTIEPSERLSLPITVSTDTWPVADLRSALDTIPCPKGYNEWFAISAAFYDACGGSGEGYLMWDRWCSTGPGYDQGRPANRLWRSLTCRGYTAGTLVHEARVHRLDWDRPSCSGFTKLKFFNSKVLD
jgi:hypothetical protein